MTQEALEALKFIENHCRANWMNEYNFNMDHFKTIRKALEGDKWKPIETAPKNRGSILVHCGNLHNTYVVYWSTYLNDQLGTYGWIHFGSCNVRLYETPTHWMPLPTPPKGEDDEV